jgi:hypothetical protein
MAPTTTVTWGVTLVGVAVAAVVGVAVADTSGVVVSEITGETAGVIVGRSAGVVVSTSITAVGVAVGSVSNGKNPQAASPTKATSNTTVKTKRGRIMERFDMGYLSGLF